MNFKEYFCLADKERFQIDPISDPKDRAYYFGRSDLIEKLKRSVDSSFIDPGVPKFVIHGEYGCGKTQTLYHLSHLLKNSPPANMDQEDSVHPVHVIVELARTSHCMDLYAEIMNRLGMEQVQQWVQGLFNNTSDFDAELRSMMRDPNRVKALVNIRGAGGPALDAWRWLSGEKLSNAQLQNLGITRNLGSSAGELVEIINDIGKLAKSNNYVLIVYLDECEQLRNVTEPDAVASLQSFFRRWGDNNENGTGVFLSLFAPSIDDMPPMIDEEAFRRRFRPDHMIDIPNFESSVATEAFMKELLARFIDRELAEKKIQDEGLQTTLDTYPFDAAAWDNFMDLASQDSTKDLPSYIITALSECAIEAFTVGSPVITAEIVDQIAPSMFLSDTF